MPLPPPAAPTSRSCYLYVNEGLQVLSVEARSVYDYVNRAVQVLSVEARSVYDYVNRGIEALAVLDRALYDYEAGRDTPVFPWLEKLDPTQQYPGGTVDLYGDGFGQYKEVGAGSTITTSSVNGSHIGSNVVARDASLYWQSTEGATAWIRFTFGTALTIYGIALEDLIQGGVTEQWGAPLFRFSDGGADVIGATGVPIPTTMDRSAEYPVGTVRTLYVLPAERPGITWVEVRVNPGTGAGSQRGLSQAWVYADEGTAAETSQVILNALNMGIVSWSGRSVGLWPANGGVPQAPAATVTVPLLGTSGLVRVEES